jgi:hypothetical protein
VRRNVRLNEQDRSQAMIKDIREHQAPQANSMQGAIELDEVALEGAQGGAAYIKFDGIDGDVGPTRAQRAETPKIRHK